MWPFSSRSLLTSDVVQSVLTKTVIFTHMAFLFLQLKNATDLDERVSIRSALRKLKDGKRVEKKIGEYNSELCVQGHAFSFLSVQKYMAYLFV